MPDTNPVTTARTLVVTALLLALAGLLLGFLALALTLAAGTGTTSAVVLRGLFVLPVVLLLSRAAARRAVTNGLPNAVPVVMAAAVCGYLLDLFSWNGRALITQLVADPGVVTFAGDAVLWLLVAAAGAFTGARGAQAPERSRTVYG